MSELTMLNDEIVKLELALLEKQKTYAASKKNMEICKLSFKETLDKKQFSNDDKREIEALKNDMIANIVKDLQDFDFEIKVLSIEIDFKMRLFKILLKGDDP